MIRTALRILLASAFATSGAVFAQAPERIVFATDWLAQAEHGGFYQALAEGTYRKYGLDVTIKMGGPQVNGLQLLAAGQLDVVMGDALQVALGRRAEACRSSRSPRRSRRIRRSIIAHPGVATLADLKGKPIAVERREQHDVLAVAQAALRIHRRPEAPVRVQRAAVPRRPEAVAAGLRHVRAVLDRKGRREAGRVPARGPRAIRRIPKCWPSRATRSTSAPTRSRASSARPPKAGRAISRIRRPATRSSSATIRRCRTSSSPTATARCMEYAIVTGGDTATAGLLTMTDARWRQHDRLPARRGA